MTMAQAPAYAGTARLVALMATLPVPSEEPQDHWFQLWQAADDPVLLPANLRHQMLRAVDGDGTALADQLLGAVAGMSSDQRTAAAELIGTAIGMEFLSGYEAGYVGELWLREGRKRGLADPPLLQRPQHLGRPAGVPPGMERRLSPEKERAVG
ncbi:hypothetical protein [Streptomyces anulatus]|uniref:hypothetical protein n=1 Tax=Streptomyces anulatus TaxID=1892 RepID=UPI00363CCE02|nr:hypothetical protein OG865_37040 [Streptomyces anulatus]